MEEVSRSGVTNPCRQIIKPIRNMVVWLLSTPTDTEGSVNEPCGREEHGIRFNEKWIYRDLHDDPAAAPMRIVYWLRYDFAGTVVRSSASENWRIDHELERVLGSDRLRIYHNNRRTPEELWVTLKERDRRLYWLAGPGNTPVTPTNQYRPVSECEEPGDLGGYIQGRRGRD
jgi:hypothetical protein